MAKSWVKMHSGRQFLGQKKPKSCQIPGGLIPKTVFLKKMIEK